MHRCVVGKERRQMQEKLGELFMPLPTGQINWDVVKELAILFLRSAATHQQHTNICQ